MSSVEVAFHSWYVICPICVPGDEQYERSPQGSRHLFHTVLNDTLEFSFMTWVLPPHGAKAHWAETRFFVQNSSRLASLWRNGKSTNLPLHDKEPASQWAIPAIARSSQQVFMTVQKVSNFSRFLRLSLWGWDFDSHSGQFQQLMRLFCRQLGAHSWSYLLSESWKYVSCDFNDTYRCIRASCRYLWRPKRWFCSSAYSLSFDWILFSGWTGLTTWLFWTRLQICSSQVHKIPFEICSSSSLAESTAFHWALVQNWLFE